MEEINIEQIEELKNTLLAEINEFKKDNNTVHPYDIAKQLQDLRHIDKDSYIVVLKKIPHELFAEVLSEFPEYIQEEIADTLSNKKLSDIASKMDTDDAADFIQTISEDNQEIANVILESFDEDDKELIEQLISYEEDEAGAYMQTELFSSSINSKIGDAIEHLKQLKEKGEIENIWHCHLVDDDGNYMGSVGLEELIIFSHDATFLEIPNEKLINFHTTHKTDIKDVVDIFSNYNLTSLPVVDDKNKLIGRITTDDILDVMQENATEQIYNMAGLDDEAEQEENLFEIGKTRAIWLGLNLITAIAASIVIGMFDATIQSLVALAILMPIVASMGGNAGTQTLTVTVRQMALGDINNEDAKKTVIKEVIISLANGLIFALVIGIIAYLWFKIPLLGLVIALSMIINLLSAGFFGAMIPLVLQKMKIDPAIGSTVLLTTITDVVGFFSFLGLATIILL